MIDNYALFFGVTIPLILIWGSLRRITASVDRNPEGEKPQALSAEHESAAPKADAQTSTPEIEAEISRLQVGGL